MTSQTSGSGMSFQLRRVFRAEREKVFAAWTRREQLEEWMCKDVPAHDPKYVELDVRPGGRYVIEIPIPGGKYVGQGVFREVKPPEKLVFTWSWKREPERSGERVPAGESLVTVELFEQGGATEMVFTHEYFESAEVREETRTGWLGCFEILAKVVEA